MNTLMVAAASGTSVITEAMKTTLTTGFADLQATVVDVMGISVPVAIACIALVAGIGFGLKQLKGVLSQAS